MGERRVFLQYGPWCCCEVGICQWWGGLSVAPLSIPWPLSLQGQWNTNDHWPIHSWVWWWFEFGWSSYIKDFQSIKLTFTCGTLIIFVPLVSFSLQSQLLLNLHASAHLSLLWKPLESPQCGVPPTPLLVPFNISLTQPSWHFCLGVHLSPPPYQTVGFVTTLTTLFQQQERCQVHTSHSTNICRMNEWNGFKGQNGVELTNSKWLFEQYQKQKGYLRQEFLIQLNQRTFLTFCGFFRRRHFLMSISVVFTQPGWGKRESSYKLLSENHTFQCDSNNIIRPSLCLSRYRPYMIISTWPFTMPFTKMFHLHYVFLHRVPIWNIKAYVPLCRGWHVEDRMCSL